MVKLTIVGIEDKRSKTNVKYWVVKDSDGNTHSIWNEDIADTISIGQERDYIVKEANGFSNIRGINTEGTVEKEVPKVAEQTVNTLKSPVVEKELNKVRTTRYAREVTAGELVKVIEKVYLREESMDWGSAQALVVNTFNELLNVTKD